MDTNASTNLDLGSPALEDQTQPVQDELQSLGTTLMENRLHENPDRIELCVRDDLSDTLKDESPSQTPNDNDLSNEMEENSAIRVQPNAKGMNAAQGQKTSAIDCGSLSAENSDADDNTVIRVKESEDADSESIEIELEEDNSLLLTSLTSLFPDATGLKFRNPKTNTMRGVKLVDGRFVEPNNGWPSVRNYICVFIRGGAKRKFEEDAETGKRLKTDSDRPDSAESFDLIVPNLACTTTDETMRSYFEQYGQVTMTQVKTDQKCSMSGGFGIVRIASACAQNEILSKKHLIDGKWCEVFALRDRTGAETTNPTQVSRRVYVNRLPDSTTREDLMNYFSQYGTITDIYIPRLFRNFAFVTFETLDMVKSLFKNKHEHKINGTLIQISEAIPKINNLNSHGGNNGGSYGGGTQPVSGNFAGNYVRSAGNNIHTFGNNYGSPRTYHHHHRKNNPALIPGGGAYGGRKMHQRSSYDLVNAYGSPGPASGIDPASYANQTYYEALALAASGCNQNSAGANGAQYFKMQQQQQPVVASSQNHGAYPNPSSYSNHEGANLSRGS